MPAAASCRENADRAIFVNDLIDQRLVNSLTPQILKLRQENHEPITVYIDSRGGYPNLAETLINLLQAPDADGEASSLVTVVTGYAASAAADFLAAGRYTIAYPKATVHFHGTRYGKQEDITMESAATTAKFLRESNERLAVDLATNIVGRSIFVYLNLRDSFPKIRADEPSLTDIECFARALYRKLSFSAKALPLNALKRYREIQVLSDYVFGKVKIGQNDRLAKTERSILRAIIEYEYRSTKTNPTWSFTEENVEKISEDFRLIKDFFVGSHNDAIEPLARNFGRFFLSEDDTKAFEANNFPNDQERDTWLQEKAIPGLRPVWYFIVSICRLLQEKENPLTALDAYWLGVVNEVMGSDLPCLRQVLENPPKDSQPSKVESPTVSTPPESDS